ncbi:hypothetical protein ACLQ29_33535 [Micromonospora sp. DT228]|uniref:hypothetical protein n=1 Tax=Micromonospora sp. DT228 TaxID=3393443 RepID=UPI003CFA3417
MAKSNQNQNVGKSLITRTADLRDAKTITAKADRTKDRTERKGLDTEAARLRAKHGQ